MPDETCENSQNSAGLNLAYPLDTFYIADGRRIPPIERVVPGDVPEPYHGLLVGEHDMTPTLEAFHGSEIHIRPIEHVVDGLTYSRLVVLLLEDGTPVEFGAIVIYLDCLPPEGRSEVLEGRVPLGSVLAHYRVRHASCPRAFVKVQPDDLMKEHLHLSGNAALYGRRNVLLTADHRVLADILEILPPHPDPLSPERLNA